MIAVKYLFIFSFAILSLFILYSLPAQSLPDQITVSLLNNRAIEAKSLLNQAVIEDPKNPMIYLHLGLVNEQLGLYQEAILALTKGLPYAEEHLGLFYLNIGNNRIRLREWGAAEESYNRAIAFSPRLGGAYINRANLLVRLEQYRAAILDYRSYLDIALDTPKREEVKKMIALLERKEQEAEEMRLAEEMRQQALLDAALNSLDNLSDSVREHRADPEDIADIPDIPDIAE